MTRPFISTIPKLSALLVFLPVAIVMQSMHVGGLPLFIVSAVGILGTVTMIGKATEEIAVYAGPLWGGLLNATFGNVTELIIALFALRAGIEAADLVAQERMFNVVRASIVGSIIGNLLLVLGAAMVYGGAKFTVQKFSRTGAAVNIGMLWISVIILSVPSMIEIASYIDPHLDNETAKQLVRDVSVAGSVILLGIYVLSLLFSLRTHRYLLMPGDAEEEPSEWSKKTSIVVLLMATACVAYLSEAFVHSIQEMVESGAMQMSEMFIGVIVVAVVGNAAEGMVAVWVARENKMELSFQIAMGSCLQVALLVAPVLVLASSMMGELMTLEFNPFQLMSLGAAVLIAGSALNDGESNWLEGSMLLAVYIFFAMVFWFHP